MLLKHATSSRGSGRVDEGPGRTASTTSQRHFFFFDDSENLIAVMTTLVATGGEVRRDAAKVGWF
jgi:hypothetical protein